MNCGSFVSARFPTRPAKLRNDHMGVCTTGNPGKTPVRAVPSLWCFTSYDTRLTRPGVGPEPGPKPHCVLTVSEKVSTKKILQMLAVMPFLSLY